MSTHKPLTKVNINSEDGELKEVIYGMPDDLIVPEYNPGLDFVKPETHGAFQGGFAACPDNWRPKQPRKDRSAGHDR